jgi:threonine aldolase
MAGGGMRQAGLLAAAAHYALDQHVERLREDHANAKRLAAGLAGLPGVSFAPPATNILFVDLAPELVQARTAARWGGAHDTLVDHLRARGVLCTGLYKLRFVTHLDVDAAAIDRAIVEIRAALGG